MSPPSAANLDIAEASLFPSRHEVELWLGTPAGRTYFDVAALDAAEQARYRASLRRRPDFEVSRALSLHGPTDGTRTRSLSHSGGHAALLQASAPLQLGVDLELARPRDVLKIARFSFSASEVAALEAAPAERRLRLFYVLWTMKEALAKALELELLQALRHCTFELASTDWQGDAPTAQPWTVQVFEPRPTLVLAIACVGTDQRPLVHAWEWPPRRPGAWPVIAAASAPAGAAAPPASIAGTA